MNRIESLPPRVNGRVKGILIIRVKNSITFKFYGNTTYTTIDTYKYFNIKCNKLKWLEYTTDTKLIHTTNGNVFSPINGLYSNNTIQVITLFTHKHIQFYLGALCLLQQLTQTLDTSTDMPSTDMPSTDMPIISTVSTVKDSTVKDSTVYESVYVKLNRIEWSNSNTDNVVLIIKSSTNTVINTTDLPFTLIITDITNIIIIEVIVHSTIYITTLSLCDANTNTTYPIHDILTNTDIGTFYIQLYFNTAIHSTTLDTDSLFNNNNPNTTNHHLSTVYSNLQSTLTFQSLSINSTVDDIADIANVELLNTLEEVSSLYNVQSTVESITNKSIDYNSIELVNTTRDISIPVEYSESVSIGIQSIDSVIKSTQLDSQSICIPVDSDVAESNRIQLESAESAGMLITITEYTDVAESRSISIGTVTDEIKSIPITDTEYTDLAEIKSISVLDPVSHNSDASVYKKEDTENNQAIELVQYAASDMTLSSPHTSYSLDIVFADSAHVSTDTEEEDYVQLNFFPHDALLLTNAAQI